MLGLSRSGNHAIADWIYLQAPRPRAMLNCAEGKTDPFDTCRPMGDGCGWRADPDACARDRHADRRLLLHSYEDSWIRHAFSATLESRHDDWLGPSRRRVALIVLRDPFNLFASRLRAGAGVAPDLAMRIWCQHARAALGRGPSLPMAVRPVLYNHWAADPAYRRDLAAWLGLPFTDEGHDRVPGCNGGSSFDGTAFDGAAATMRTGDRWRAFARDPDYRRLFSPQVIRLAGQVFGPAPEIEGALDLAAPAE